MSTALNVTTTRTHRVIAFPRVQSGHSLGIWHAHACDSSVIKRTFVGFTRQHAENRAQRWLDRNS